MTNPLEDIVVARGTTLGNMHSPMYVIQTELRTYIASSLEDCRRSMQERSDETPLNAAGPASRDLRLHVARLFSEIGFFS